MRRSCVSPVIVEAIEPRILLSTSPPTSTIAPITPVVETVPVTHAGDAADDIAVWVNPTDRAQSAIIGTDKNGALDVYSNTGARISTITGGNYNGVDLRTGFLLGGQSSTLVGATNRTTNQVQFFKLDPVTRTLTSVGSFAIHVSGEIYGLTMYRSTAGQYSAFVVTKTGNLEQFRLNDAGPLKVSATSVRTIAVGSISEGMVVDDDQGLLYVAQEDVGIWRYGANSGDGSGRTLIDSVSNGQLKADIEGLALYTAPNNQGYLIASSQGSDDFVVYDRVGYTYVTRFKISSGAIDGVNGTDGIEVVSASLGGNLSEGAFIAQDNSNDVGRQNFKFVSWGDISRAQGIPLLIAAGNGPGANQPPIVSAGRDVKAQTFSHTIPLYGSVTDDGGPLAKPIIWWEVLSKPAGSTVTFRYEGVASTPATFSAAGTYRLRLGAYDGNVMSVDDLTVTAGPFSTKPIVNAGPDQTLAVSRRTTLNGTVTDDGLVNPKLIIWWEVLAKPAGSTVALQYEGVAKTPVTFSMAGTYTLRLGAYDGDEMTLDTMIVTVLSSAI